ncbi:glutaredoxin [Paenibacillus sp. NEAU-GSW1]|uniref:glutaredoxin n=1 Tax=Paenibacillus sp. NEAU-GSW1 TaxID=2682486 RepID=UPI0012E31232|nr:glutaredoxin [Paenibacillus sp. NEAU-GSW1]MUT64854.1 glutaredoxin [Paenibacillus sp. NEAU-GSW1]
MAKIEVFTADTYLCEDLLKQVKELACSKCEVVVYDLTQSNVTAELKDIARSYGIQSIPSVVLNGRMVDVEKIKSGKLNGLAKPAQHD